MSGAGERPWHGPSAKVNSLAYGIAQRATKIANLGPGEERKITYQIREMWRALDELIEQAKADRDARLAAEAEAAAPAQAAPAADREGEGDG